MELDLATFTRRSPLRFRHTNAIVWRDRRLTWADITDRTRRLANLLLTRAWLRKHADPTSVEPGGSRRRTISALYLTNCNEYLEGMLGAIQGSRRAVQCQLPVRGRRARVLLRRRSDRAVIYRARYGAVARRRAATAGPPSRCCCSRSMTSPATTCYQAACVTRKRWAASEPGPPPVDRAPTTCTSCTRAVPPACPKGTLWRQADFLVFGPRCEPARRNGLRIDRRDRRHRATA